MCSASDACCLPGAAVLGSQLPAWFVDVRAAMKNTPYSAADGATLSSHGEEIEQEHLQHQVSASRDQQLPSC